MKKEKTMYELVKEFPDKSYRELEIYRDADRQEEADRIPLTESQQKQEDLEPIGMGHNHPPDEGEEQDNPTLWEIAKEHKISYADAVPIQEDMRLKRDALKAACTLGEMRKHRTPLTNMKKRAEEAEGELSIMKGIETNRVKEAQAKSNQLQDEVERVKKDNNDLYNRIADALEVNESHQKVNGKLQERLTELEEENKKMHARLDERIDSMRKSGM
jgi:hypothetical protein